MPRSCSSLLLFLATGLLALPGCARPMPVFNPLPEAPPAKQPEIPKPETEEVVIVIPKIEARLADDAFILKPDAYQGREKTVLISPPREVVLEQQAVNRDVPSDPDVFRTSGYYNEAEREVERAFLQMNWTILDRSKFEAKLREARERTQSINSSDPGRKEAEEQARKDRDEGKITHEEYLQRLAAIDKTYRETKGGAIRLQAGENVMVDIAEAVRATQEGKDRAEFILTVAHLTMDRKSGTFPLRNREEFADYLKRNPKAKDRIPVEIPPPWFQGDFAAKLIAVNDGKIVWLGNHTVESNAAEEIRITYKATKTPSNSDAIKLAVNRYNAKLEEAVRSAQALKNQAESQHQAGAEDAVVDRTMAAYEAALGKLKELTDQRTAIETTPFEYEYALEGYVSPGFFTLPGEASAKVRDDLSVGEKARLVEQMKEHRQRLTKVLVGQILRTLEPKHP